MMVNVPPPGSRGNGSRLTAPPPAPAEIPNNMATKNELADMNFKVSPELKNRVKMEAVARNITMRDMVGAALKLYFETYPVEIRKQELL